MAKQSGWKPIPIPLKILLVVILLWVVGSVFAVQMRFDQGLPFFGIWVSGMIAASIVILLDILAPLAFLVGVWKRKSWAPTVAYSYMGIFILSSAVALVTVREQLGTMPILIPALVTLTFIGVVSYSKTYFE